MNKNNINSEIDYIINTCNFIRPLYEDEIPVAYPVPQHNRWDKISQEKYNELENIISGCKVESLYINIPYCKFKCTYCVYQTKTNTGSKSNEVTKYLELLQKEFDLYKSKGIQLRGVKKIYIGGGTPSILNIDQLNSLFNIISTNVRFEKNYSFTFELSPNTIDADKIALLVNNGVNRFSIGIQDVNENILKQLCRRIKHAEIESALDLLNASKIYYNTDLIYGLPNQKFDDWINSINELLKKGVPEFTLYNLRIGRNSEINKLDLSLAEEKKWLFNASEIIKSNNYIQVRPFHWVKEPFLTNWKEYKYAPVSNMNNEFVLGIGTSAISYINGFTFKNHEINDHTYANKLKRNKLPINKIYQLTEKDNTIQKMIRDVENVFFDIKEYNEKSVEIIDFLINNKLCEKKDNKVILNNIGLLFYNNIQNYIIDSSNLFQDITKITQIKDDIINNQVCNEIIDTIENNSLKILELGSGIGAISIPIILKLIDKVNKFDTLIIDWYCIDINKEKISFYIERLKSYLNGFPVEENNKSISITLKKGVFFKILLEVENVEKLIYKDVKIKFNTIFAPSFLYHLTYWKRCLVWMQESLIQKGKIILGYPVGNWEIPQHGQNLIFDKNNTDENWITFWQLFFIKNPNFVLFFRRFYTALSKTYMNDQIKKIGTDTILGKPDANLLYRLISSGDFSFLKDVATRKLNSNQISLLQSLESIDNYKYEFEVIPKLNCNNYKVLNQELLYETDLSNRILASEILEQDIGKRLSYSIVKVIVGEGILDRYHEKYNTSTVIGSFVGNKLNSAVNNNFDPDVYFFSKPIKEDLSLLHQYMCFYRIPKSIPITNILTDYLPTYYPNCRYIVFEYNVSEENIINIEYDHNTNIYYIRIFCYINGTTEKLFDTEKNTPEYLYDSNSEIIAYRYAKEDIGIKNNIEFNTRTCKTTGEEYERIINYLISHKQEYQPANEDDMKTRFLILAYTFLTNNINSSLGIPLRGTIANKPNSLGILWLVYRNKWENIKEIELDFIKKFKSIVIEPIIKQLISFLLEVVNLRLKSQQKLSAGVVILVESYAHNIGAHGLEGLRQYLLEQWKSSGIDLNRTDLNIAASKIINESVLNFSDLIRTHKQFPTYVFYLQGKSAFWNAISRGGRMFGVRTFSLWQLFDEFAKNNLLCGALGASEGYKTIKIIYQEDENNSYELFTSSFEKVKDHNAEKTKKLDEIVVCMPEGIVGQHALYTILENIVRNIKHCYKNASENNFTIPLYFKTEDKEDGDKITLTFWIALESRESVEIGITKMNNWEGILKTEQPNMGGTSQNVLCSGMIKGMTFLDAEKKQLSKNNDEHLIRFSSINNNYLAYSIDLWKGRDFINWENIKGKSSYEDNVSRYRIIKLKDQDKESYKKLSNPIRHVFAKSDDLGELYKEWNETFFSDNFFPPEGICVNVDRVNECWKIERNSNDIITYYFYHKSPPHENGVQDKLIPYKGDTSFIPSNINDESEKLEFAETILSKVLIIDDRIYKIYKSFAQDQQNMLKDLNTFVFGENIGKRIKKCKNRYHFLVVHLSYIEKYYGKKEEDINIFIEEFLNNFKFIIVTSGRGRDLYSYIKPNYHFNTRYIPIENLQYCFLYGVLLDTKSPSIGIKHLLVKTIFGS